MNETQNRRPFNVLLCLFVCFFFVSLPSRLTIVSSASAESEAARSGPMEMAKGRHQSMDRSRRRGTKKKPNNDILGNRNRSTTVDAKFEELKKERKRNTGESSGALSLCLIFLSSDRVSLDFSFVPFCLVVPSSSSASSSSASSSASSASSSSILACPWRRPAKVCSSAYLGRSSPDTETKRK